MGPRLAALAVTAAAFAACYVGPIDPEGGTRPGSSTTPTEPSGSASPSGDGGGAANGLPCEVDAILEKRCRSCHAGASSPQALATYEDLTAPSKKDPARKVAIRALERMLSPTSPMPPPPNAKVPDAEVAVFRAWVESGMARGACGVPEAGTSAVDGGAVKPSSVCTSQKTWQTNKKGPDMQPGRACITCHEGAEDKPVVWVGGTVYPTLHEPDQCYGVPGGASVVVTDATGRSVTLAVGPTGNFSLSAETSAALAMPIRAKVVSNGVERAMASPQNSGDCNKCHTETGANGAPGRILLP